MDFYELTEGKKRTSLELRNNGIGPAVITGIEIEYLDTKKKEPDFKGLADFVVRCGWKNNEMNGCDMDKFTAIPAGDNQPILWPADDRLSKATDADVLAQIRKFKATTRKMNITIQYQSIYGEPQIPCELWETLKGSNQ